MGDEGRRWFVRGLDTQKQRSYLCVRRYSSSYEKYRYRDLRLDAGLFRNVEDWLVPRRGEAHHERQHLDGEDGLS